MSMPRINADKVLTSAERSQRYRDKKKTKAERLEREAKSRGNHFNARLELFNAATDEELDLAKVAQKVLTRLHPDNKLTGNEKAFKKVSRFRDLYFKEGHTWIHGAVADQLAADFADIPTKPANVAATNDKGVRVATKEEKGDISAAETPKATEPPQPAIVTPSTATPSELAREIEQQPQEQTAATCATCGRDVEMKDGRIGWHVNLGTFEDCTGGADFETMCRSISADVRSGTGLEAKQS
jgi:hypothetical protein